MTTTTHTAQCLANAMIKAIEHARDTLLTDTKDPATHLRIWATHTGALNAAEGALNTDLIACICTPADQQTWTFVGHWEDDCIFVEYVLPGRVPDLRENTGYWEQGLWCDYGTGTDLATVQAAVIAAAEAENRADEDDEDPEDTTPVASDPVLTVCGTCEDYVNDPRLVQADDDFRSGAWLHVANDSERCPGQEDDETDDRAEPIQRRLSELPYLTAADL